MIGMATSPTPTTSPALLAEPTNTPNPAPGIVDGAKNKSHIGSGETVFVVVVVLVDVNVVLDCVPLNLPGFSELVR